MGRPTTLRRLVLLLGGGALVLYAALQWEDSTAEVPRVLPGSGRTAAARIQSKPALSLTLPVRAAVDLQPQGNLFAPTSWLPPPPPPPPPQVVVPPPPQAPPLPFRFVGLLEDAAKPTAFLSRGDALLIVSAGETLDGGYRVDTITSKEIVLTYLPMNKRQLIRIAGDL